MAYCSHGCGNASCVLCAIEKQTKAIIDEMRRLSAVNENRKQEWIWVKWGRKLGLYS